MSLPKDRNQHYELGIKMISSAINIDETLSQVLRLEINRAKKTLSKDSELEGINNLTKTLRNVIALLILTEERIEKGILLCNMKDEDGEPPH